MESECYAFLRFSCSWSSGDEGYAASSPYDFSEFHSLFFPSFGFSGHEPTSKPKFGETIPIALSSRWALWCLKLVMTRVMPSFIHLLQQGV
jgi:hypothetical protein